MIQCPVCKGERDQFDFCKMYSLKTVGPIYEIVCNNCGYWATSWFKYFLKIK